MSNQEPVRTRRSGAPDYHDELSFQHANQEPQRPLNPWLFGAIMLGGLTLVVAICFWLLSPMIASAADARPLGCEQYRSGEVAACLEDRP